MSKSDQNVPRAAQGKLEWSAPQLQLLGGLRDVHLGPASIKNDSGSNAMS